MILESDDSMAHPLEGLTLEIKKQIKERNYVHVVVDKETIDKMRKSIIGGSIKSGGIDERIRGFGTKSYTIDEDVRWISSYIKRKVEDLDHKLKFIKGRTEIHIMTDE